mgnify:CR=1 FL=1
MFPMKNSKTAWFEAVATGMFGVAIPLFIVYTMSTM